MHIPLKIYVQFRDEYGDPNGEITWCEDRVHDTDVEYARVGTCSKCGCQQIVSRMVKWDCDSCSDDDWSDPPLEGNAPD